MKFIKNQDVNDIAKYLRHHDVFPRSRGKATGAALLPVFWSQTSFNIDVPCATHAVEVEQVAILTLERI